MQGNMLAMSQISSVTRLTLLPAADPAPRAAGVPKVRRYRLATVRPAASAPGAKRFAHLKRTYD